MGLQAAADCEEGLALMDKIEAGKLTVDAQLAAAPSVRVKVRSSTTEREG